MAELEGVHEESEQPTWEMTEAAQRGHLRRRRSDPRDGAFLLFCIKIKGGDKKKNKS